MLTFCILSDLEARECYLVYVTDSIKNLYLISNWYVFYCSIILHDLIYHFLKLIIRVQLIEMSAFVF